MNKKYFWIKVSVILLFLLLSIVVSFRLKNAPNIQVGSNQIEVMPREEIKLLFVGDTGSGNEFQLKVAQAMERYCIENSPLDGIVLLGDNFYMEGVSSIDDEQWQSKIEIPYGSECLRNLPIYPILGNHDYRKNPSAQIEYSTKNPRWKFPHRFYSVNFKEKLRLVAFDSSFPDFCFLDYYCATDFLLSELNKPAVWKVTVAHNPLASASVKGYAHSGGLFGFLMRPLVCGKTDFWVNGHAHHLEHRVEEGCDTDLITSGGGGGNLTDFIHNQNATKFAAKKYGFFAMRVSDSQVETAFIDQNGEVIYQYNKEKK